MKMVFKKKVCLLILFLTMIIAGCVVEGNPDFWANSYFIKKSPYPMGLINPIKIEYKYSNPRTIIQTNDNGYLFGGSIRTFEESNAMLVKLSSTGVVEKGFVVHDGLTMGEDRQSGIVTSLFDTGNGFVIAGWTNRDESSNIIKGNTSMWLMKTDYAGGIVWNRAYGQFSYYEDMDSGSNDAFLAGVVSSTVMTSDGGFVMGGKQLVKVNAHGDIEWSKINTLGSIKDLKLTNDNGLIIVAEASGFNTNTIAKTDDMGNIIWSKEYHIGDLQSTFNTVEVITNESGAETGYLLGGKVIYPVRRSSDCLLVALNTDGNLNWNTTYNGVIYDDDNMIFSEETIGSIIRSNDGNYLVGITSESFQADLNMEDAIVIKMDSNGTIIWEKAYDVYGGEFRGMAATNNGFVISSELSGQGDWHSLVVTCQEDGTVPDHGDDLTIKDVSFMSSTPESVIIDTTGDDIFTSIDLVTDDLRSTLKDSDTDRVRR